MGSYLAKITLSSHFQSLSFLAFQLGMPGVDDEVINLPKQKQFFIQFGLCFQNMLFVSLKIFYISICGKERGGELVRKEGRRERGGGNRDKEKYMNLSLIHSPSAYNSQGWDQGLNPGARTQFKPPTQGAGTK